MTPGELRELLAGIRANAVHNRRVKGSVTYGDLVCVCAVPDANPRIDFGECRQCRRKPLALFTAAL